MNNRNPDHEVWMRLARDDMATVELLMTEHKKRVEIILYHCQQTAEKALKAYLVFCGTWAGNTHDLVLLLQTCAGINRKFHSPRMVSHCAYLNRITPDIKYAELNISFDASHIPRAINSAKRVYESVSIVLGLGRCFFA